MEQRPLIIGIAGGSGSGKTHLARQVQSLAGTHRAALLCMDSYFRTERAPEPAEVNFDHPAHLDLELMAEQLDLLRAGQAVRAPVYDFRTMIQTPEAEEIPSRPVIIVEGLFALASPILDRLDFSCFLDVDADQRLLGRLLRDSGERGATLSETVDRYQRFVRPCYNVFVAPTRQNADVVVDFTYRRSFFTSLLAELVREYLQGGLDVEGLVNRVRRDTFRLGYKAAEPIMPMNIDIRVLARAFPEQEVQHSGNHDLLAGPWLFVDTAPNGAGKSPAKE